MENDTWYAASAMLLNSAAFVVFDVKCSERTAENKPKAAN
jgi:hypothetical protein